MASSKKRKCYLEGYRSSIQDEGSKKRYLDKLKLIGGLDPYETDKKEWKDDVDLWPCITHGAYRHVSPDYTKSLHWRTVAKLQELGLLPKFSCWVSERSDGAGCVRL